MQKRNKTVKHVVVLPIPNKNLIGKVSFVKKKSVKKPQVGDGFKINTCIRCWDTGFLCFPHSVYKSLDLYSVYLE